MGILRRLRGIVGIAVTWGVGLSALATTVLAGGLALGIIPGSIIGTREVIVVAVRGLLAGALAGTLFATVLARAERRTTLAALAPRRVALWGFIGGACIPGVFAAALGVTGLLPIGLIVGATLAYGVIGSAMGAATVRMARRAPILPAESASDVMRVNG